MSVIRAALLAEELESLRQLTCEALRMHVPVLHGDKLVRCGFAKIGAGALIITTMGRAKLAFEITRASWLAAPV